MARKSFLLIGMGKFGHFLCRQLAEQGNDVMIADANEDKLSDLLDCAASAKIGDCSRREVLITFGVEDFDACVVCIADDFQDSLETTDLLKELGARYIISLAGTETQAKFLLKNGADEVVFPERDIAERYAVSLSSDSIFDYFELSDDLSIYEISTPEKWRGKTVAQMDVRRKYGLSIVTCKDADGRLFVPGAEHTFSGEEHLLVLGERKNVDAVIDR